MMSNSRAVNIDRLRLPFQENRRSRPRTEIHATIQYQVQGEITFKECVLHNISETGVLISCSQDLDIGADVHVVMESENPDELAIHILGTVVRKTTEPGVDDVCYGCRIDRVSDPN